LLLANKQNTGHCFLGSLCNFEASDELYLIDWTEKNGDIVKEIKMEMLRFSLCML